MTIPVSYRQGDIYLKEVSKLPEIEDKNYLCIEGPQIERAIVLAHGESTGHKHAIYDGNAFLVKEKDSNNFFLMVIKPTKLQHEEHAAINLPIGNYEVIRKREYFPGAIRQVVD